MLAAIDWDLVWTAVAAWVAVTLVPFVVLGLLFAIYLVCLAGAYFVDWLSGGRW